MSTIRSATFLDLGWIAARMRPEDAFGMDPWANVSAMARFPIRMWTLEGADGAPLAVAGFTQTGPHRLNAWLLASGDLRPVAFPLYRAARAALDMHRDYLVTTRCPASWETANRWLRRLGFIVDGSDGTFNLYRKDRYVP